MIIRKLRLQRGWSQEQLAEVSGVSVRTIQRIEQGQRASLESLKCLAAVFETPIPDLQKDPDMPELETAPPSALTDADRAALKYAHYLKSYDKSYAQGDDGYPEMTPVRISWEKRVIQQVKEIRKFYSAVIFCVVVILFLLILNLMTSPAYLWVVWPALGLAIALALSGLYTFGRFGTYADDWERRKIEERLQNL